MTSLNKKSVKVQQIGSTLVAAYDTANPPLIWKFDLERNHSFALALQGGDSGWELGVTSGRNEFHPVARFPSREDAEYAFAKTQEALLGKKSSGWRIAVLSFIAAVVLLVIIFILPMMSMMHNLRAGAMGNRTSAAAVPNQMKDGVPMDADQVLKPPP